MEEIRMGLFGKRESKDTQPCCCGGNCDSQSREVAQAGKAEGASVKVLGSGCAKCNALEAATKAALAQLGMYFGAIGFVTLLLTGIAVAYAWIAAPAQALLLCVLGGVFVLAPAMTSAPFPWLAVSSQK